MNNSRKLPIGIQTFENLRKDNYLYIDKTDLIYQIVTNGKPYFLSRPRRFGKSLLLSTMESYFLGKKDLFKGLAIENLETEWKTYPVVKISFGAGKYTNSQTLKQKLDFTLGQYEEEYGIHSKADEVFSVRMSRLILEISKITNKQVVFLIDEYDKPVLDAVYTDFENENRIILQDLYSPLKDYDEFIRFLFITGITKIDHVNIFSGLNQLNDISMDEKYFDLCGMTEKEIRETFEPEIEAFEKSKNLNSEQFFAKLREMYDGYHFTTDAKEGVYNPFSVLKSLYENKFGSYWFETATPTILLKTLENNAVDLSVYADGIETDIESFRNYEPENSSVLPIVYQSGYLTIKGYDEESELYKLGIPNKEVERGLYKILIPKFSNIPRENLGLTIEKVRRAFRADDIDGVLGILQASIADLPTIIKKDKCENYYETITHLIFRYTGFSVFSELQNVCGRSDVVVSTANSVFIFELKMDSVIKWEEAAEEGLKQIDERKYAERFAQYGKKLFKTAVVFSSEGKGLIGWKKA